MALTLTFLGFIVSTQGIIPAEDKVRAIQSCPCPTTISVVRSFLGLAGFYRRFIQGYSTITSSITDLLKSKTFTWTIEAQAAFEQLKTRLTQAPLLSLSNFNKVFEVECDASMIGVGAVLSQEKRPVAYFSEKLGGPRINYSVYDVELYAVVQALQHWRHYLLPKEFLLYTDHQVLTFVQSQNKLNTRHAKWVMMLQEFTFSIVHKSGASNKVADALIHRFNLISAMKNVVLRFEELHRELREDAEFGPIIKSVESKVRDDYLLQDGYLFFEKLLRIPNTSL